MHYFKFNNPDWHLSTGHLSAEEEGIYLRLIRHYYDTEKPIPLETESVFRRLRLSDLSAKALSILQEFFVETDKGFTHIYCNKIIAEYHKKAKTNKVNGKNGGRPSNGKASSVSHKKPSGLSVGTHEEPSRNLNQEPLTINHEPITSNQLDYSCWPQQPAQQTLDDWLAMRKRLKANVSQTVINRFSSELKKAVQFGYSVDFCLQECVTRNWRGFEVQWLLNSGISHAQSKRFTQPSDNRDKAARAADEAFGIAERGIFEGDFTRADPYGLIEQPERGVVQDLDEGAL